MRSLRSTLRCLVAVLPLGISVTLGALAACEDADVVVYTAQRFNPEAGCLEPYKPIEVVSGPGGELCSPLCLLVGADLYVSMVCPPVPANARLVPRSSPECRAALAVDASCAAEADAGDGGEPGGEGDDDDVDAGPDAALDAPADG
jgi:hypothetical protein